MQLWAIFGLLGSPHAGSPLRNQIPADFPLIDYSRIRFTLRLLRDAGETIAKTPALASMTVSNLISEEGMDLLERLLCLDQNQRITAREALAHPYFQH